MAVVVLGSTSTAGTGDCTNTPGWADIDGDGCDWYELYEIPGCPSFGDYTGYDVNTGEPLVGASVANDNCCHCFGTAVRDIPNLWSRILIFILLTIMVFNPPQAPTQSLPPSTPYPTYPPSESHAPTVSPAPTATSPCTGNTPGWKDSFGDGCSWYELADEPGCPFYKYLFKGEMGLPKDNCCYCKMESI